MPSIFIPSGAVSWESVCSEWQSELIEANAQEMSQAPADAETASSSAAIKPANIRRNAIAISMLRQNASAWQPQEIICI